MQEVTIKPRSAFKHYVTVDSPGKELCWNFCTRKKNISFGLYRKLTPNLPLGPNGLNSILSASASGSPAISPRQSVTNNTISQPSPSVLRTSKTQSNDSLAANTYDNTRSSSTQDPESLGVNKQKELLRRTSATNNAAAATTPLPRAAIDPELIELIAVAHYDSAKFTIKGSYLVEEPGTYVLLFDNTNTSKKLFFFVALKDVEKSTATEKRAVEGWVYKKGNKKMQGKSRGFVSLHNTVVRLDHDHLLIDIDSGRSLMHFKALNAQDFQMMVGAMQSFVEAKAMEQDAQYKNMQEGMFGDYGDNKHPDPAAAGDQQNGAGWTDAEMEDLQRKAENLLISLSKELAKMKDMIDTSRSRIDSKSQWKDFTLVLGSLSDVTSNLVVNATTLQRGLSTYSNNVRAHRDKTSFALRQTEFALLACLADNNRVRKKFGLEQVSVGNFMVGKKDYGDRTGSHPSSLREDVFYDAEEGANDSSDDSATSDFLGDNDDYYDDGMLRNSEDEGDGVYDDDDDYDDAPPAEMSNSNMIGITVTEPSAAAAATKSTQSIDTIAQQTQNTSATKTSNEKGSAPPVYHSLPIIRRKALPAPTVSMENVSVMSILRNNVGKDLSTVAMPIALNEPLNLLQKLCEELEYCELLEQAADCKDDIDRIIYIAAFAVSGYASTVNRAGRKPFNPLLGETYECIREDKGFKFISEKVSHHPPIMASHAEASKYVVYQDNQVKTKFWGKSMELIPSGLVNVTLKSTEDHYQWGKVTTCMRNVFSTGRYLEHYGTMKITSLKTGHTVQLIFKESGYFTSAKNEVAGTVFTPSGEEVAWLSGKWDESLHRFHKSTPNNLQVVWRARPCPSNHSQMYGFTTFAVELNEITPDIAPYLPSTDTRFRPDQRMYEEGKADEAENEKQRLEQKQREFRKKLEAEGIRWQPQWFSHSPDENSSEGIWKYKGGYFESRGKYKPQVELW
ncbi:Oxysterol-binding protein- protein 3 [Chytridiales sp. JEL 0842]|nr:Oxysterol-binding protein- protein 3 [Chytridiales sp. JEL 0842]